jgi:hypothetical protein
MNPTTRSHPVPAFVSRLLWVDCIGGFAVGVTVLAFSGWLSRLDGLPLEVILFTGMANLLYGAYSFSLAIRTERPMWRIKVLVAANLAWAPVCAGLLIAFSATATPFAYLHLGGEAIYVGGLAVVEWRYRELLRTA